MNLFEQPWADAGLRAFAAAARHAADAAPHAGLKVVIVGQGPARAGLQRLLPRAVFVGRVTGAALAEACEPASRHK